jgi:hypothetical protein
MIHPSLLLAAALCVLVSVIHSWLGERKLIGPLLAPENRAKPLNSGFARKVLRYAWHVTSVTWTGVGLVLVALAFAPLDRSATHILVIVGGMFLMMGILTLLLGRGRHHAWIVFLAIAALTAMPLL